MNRWFRMFTLMSTIVVASVASIDRVQFQFPVTIRGAGAANTSQPFVSLNPYKKIALMCAVSEIFFLSGTSTITKP